MQDPNLQNEIENIVATSKDWGEVKQRVIDVHGEKYLALAKEIAIARHGEDYYYGYEYETYRGQIHFNSWLKSWQSKNPTSPPTRKLMSYQLVQSAVSALRKNIRRLLLGLLGLFLLGLIWGLYNPLPVEIVKKWEANRQENLQMNFVVKTKLVNDSMYLSIKSDAYPAYLDYVSYPLSNLNGYLTLTFEDKDGFELFKYSFQISEFKTEIDAANKKLGIYKQIESKIAPDKYKRFDHIQISWSNLITSIPKAPTIKSQVTVAKKGDVDVTDHCAPNLSRSERLRRMGLKGKVREVGESTFDGSDNSHLRLTWDGKVDQCW